MRTRPCSTTCCNTIQYRQTAEHRSTNAHQRWRVTQLCPPVLQNAGNGNVFSRRSRPPAPRLRLSLKHLQSECDIPNWIFHAAEGLLVAYLVVMAVLMLNLLIAVLSTAHSEVYERAENEFNLARTRLITESASAILRGRLPPPLNLVAETLGVLADAVGAVFQLTAKLW